jgi:hypothetical protein
MADPFNAADQVWLEQYIVASGAVAGTLHRFAPGGLRLSAAKNIPPKVCEIVGWVPEGKGMAGLAMQRREAVSTCNLKDDASGDVRPGAKAVDAQAAVALPVFDPSGEVLAVVGIAWRDDRDLPPAEIARLTALTVSLPTASGD